MKKRTLLASVLSTSAIMLSASGVFAAQTGTVKSLPAATKAAILKSIANTGLNSDVTTNTKFSMTLKSSDLAQAAKDNLPTSIGFNSNIQYDKQSSNAKGNFALNMSLTGVKSPLKLAADYQFEGLKSLNTALFFLKLSDVQLPSELFKNDTTGASSQFNTALPLLKSTWLKVDFKKLAALDPTVKTSLNESSTEIANALSGKTAVDPNITALNQKILDNAVYTIDGDKTTLTLNIPKTSPLIKQIMNSTEFKNILKNYSKQISDANKKVSAAQSSNELAEINKMLASNSISFGNIAYKIELSNGNKNIHEVSSIPMSFVDTKTQKTISGYKNVKTVSGYKSVKVKGKTTKQPVYKTTKQPIYKTTTKKTTYSVSISLDNTTSLGDVTITSFGSSVPSMDVLDLLKNFGGK